jgi:N-acetylglucosamine-6-phosphate deacetylase
MSAELLGRIVRDAGVTPGRLTIEDGLIAGVAPDAEGAGGPFIAPGFIDLHVHGWGGHDAMAGRDALGGMARALAQRGVTSFLPTAVSAPLDELHRFAAEVRAWMPQAGADGAQPLGFNLEGPFLSPERLGAHDERHLRLPADMPRGDLEPLLDGLRLVTVAPELDGALELVAWFVEHGVVVSLGHSAATLAQARAGYAAGATSTTHLFNAMTGLEHRRPGLAAAALSNDAVAVELIADDLHVDPVFYRIVARAKPPNGLFLVSDGISLAGTGDGSARLGDMAVEVRDGRATLAGSDTIAGSVIALDTALRNVIAGGLSLTDAVAAASRNPAHLLGLADRGRIEVGLRADLVELDDELSVIGAWIGGRKT